MSRTSFLKPWFLIVEPPNCSNPIEDAVAKDMYRGAVGIGQPVYSIHFTIQQVGYQLLPLFLMLVVVWIPLVFTYVIMNRCIANIYQVYMGNPRRPFQCRTVAMRAPLVPLWWRRAPTRNRSPYTRWSTMCCNTNPWCIFIQVIYHVYHYVTW